MKTDKEDNHKQGNDDKDPLQTIKASGNRTTSLFKMLQRKLSACISRPVISHRCMHAHV